MRNFYSSSRSVNFGNTSKKVVAEEIIEDLPDEEEPSAKTSKIEVIAPKAKKDESWNRSIGVLSKKNAMTNLVKAKKTKDIPSKPLQSSEVVDKPLTVSSVDVTTKTHLSTAKNILSSETIGGNSKTQNYSSTSESVIIPSGLTLLANYSGSDSDSQ